MGDYKKLAVWEKAHQLALATYKATRDFPKEELYGLTSQMRRAAVSIPSNLAEGSGKNTDAEVARFAHISLGSAKELEYQLLLAHDLGYVTDPAYQLLDIEVKQVLRMLSGFIQKLNAS
ncbi:MAG: four helix bundle protein [Anaerolineae bacterium]|nr:four helix bundle protein [Anaerolineae bacterium]